MLRKLTDLKPYTDFINLINGDPEYCDPMLSNDEQIKFNLFEAATKKDNEVIGIFKGDVIVGLFVFLVITEEKYAEMLVGLSKDKCAYDELFAFLFDNYSDYSIDFVFNPRNGLLLGKLKSFNAVFETEQQKMKLKKQVVINRRHNITLYDERYRDGYLAIHDDANTYWVGHKVLEAADRFRVILCIVDDRVVGYIVITYTFDENEPFDVFVLPEYRNRGIATEMLSYAVESNVGKDMMLSVDITNETAIRLYERSGFEKVSGNTLTAHFSFENR